MMKVALSIEAIDPPLTGIGRYTLELATRIPCCPEIDDLLFIRHRRTVPNPTAFLQTGSAVRRPPFGWIPSWLNRKLTPSRCRGRVFHGTNFFLPFFAERGVITLHDLSVAKFPETHPVERLRHYEEAFATSLSLACQIITPSETIRREVITMFNWPEERIAAIPHGVASHFRPSDDIALLRSLLKRYKLNPGQYFLSVATIEPRKKIDRLIEAYRLLPMKIRNLYPLVLVGHKGWQSDDLHDLIAKCEREGWLHYTGYVSESELTLLYQGALCFVYPSIYEGFGMPVAEAMACGVPVLTSNRSCLPEITQGAALLVDPDDLEAFSAALQHALEGQNWRQDASQSGLVVARGYRWENSVKKTVAVYAKCV